MALQAYPLTLPIMESLMVMENVEASHQLLVIVNQSAGISIMTATYRYSLLWNLGLAQIAIELVSLLLACRLWANHAVSRVSAWNRSLHNLLDEIKGLCELAEASFIDNHPSRQSRREQ